MITVRSFSVGLMGTNAYIVTDTETNEVTQLWDINEIKKFIQKNIGSIWVRI